MNEDTKEYILKWFEKADHDILTAQTVIEYQPLVLDTACFHCQQAVEKYLKAYLVYQGKIIEKTHFVSYLQMRCAEIDTEFASFDLKKLDDFAVEIRYPDDAIVPTLEEAQEYLQIAEKIKELVLKKTELI